MSNIMQEPNINNPDLNPKIQNNQEMQNPDYHPEEVVDSESSFYEGLLEKCGNCFGGLRIWIPCCCCVDNPYLSIVQSQKGLLQKFGKYQGLVGPGLININPCTEKVLMVDLKSVSVDLVKQVVLTRDNITIIVDAAVNYRIVDPQKALYKLNGTPTTVVVFLSFAAIKNVCGKYTFQELLEKRTEIARDIDDEVEKRTVEWGIKIEQVFIKDMQLSIEMQQALAAAAKERRLAESKLISAKADVESAKLMKEASDILNNKAAMQIRYLETLQHITRNPSTKIIFLPPGLDEKKFQQITQGLLT